MENELELEINFDLFDPDEISYLQLNQQKVIKKLKCFLIFYLNTYPQAILNKSLEIDLWFQKKKSKICKKIV